MKLYENSAGKKIVGHSKLKLKLIFEVVVNTQLLLYKYLPDVVSSIATDELFVRTAENLIKLNNYVKFTFYDREHNNLLQAY